MTLEDLVLRQGLEKTVECELAKYGYVHDFMVRPFIGQLTGKTTMATKDLSKNLAAQKELTGQNGSGTDWMAKELESNTKAKFQGDRNPPVKFQEGVVKSLTIDFSEPFREYRTEKNGKPLVKAIIEVLEGGEKKVFWLNKNNPLYREILEAGRSGQRVFRIVQSGKEASTRYMLLKE